MSRSTKKTNAVSTDTGIEIYPDDMHIYAQEYEDSLPHPENLYKLSSSTFTGLIRYINKKMGFTRAIYDDINLLDDIWDMYIDIAYKYDQKPVLEEFALLIGCSRDILYSWASGEYRSSDWCSKLSCSRADTVRKWQNECRLGRYKGAAAGNVGYIFLCKAVDGLVETAPVHIEQPKPKLTAEQLPRLFPPDAESLPNTDTETTKTISSDD